MEITIKDKQDIKQKYNVKDKDINSLVAKAMEYNVKDKADLFYAIDRLIKMGFLAGMQVNVLESVKNRIERMHKEMWEDVPTDQGGKRIIIRTNDDSTYIVYARNLGEALRIFKQRFGMSETDIMNVKQIKYGGDEVPR